MFSYVKKKLVLSIAMGCLLCSASVSADVYTRFLQIKAPSGLAYYVDRLKVKFNGGNKSQTVFVLGTYRNKIIAGTNNNGADEHLIAGEYMVIDLKALDQRLGKNIQEGKSAWFVFDIAGGSQNVQCKAGKNLKYDESGEVSTDRYHLPTLLLGGTSLNPTCNWDKQFVGTKSYIRPEI